MPANSSFVLVSHFAPVDHSSGCRCHEWRLILRSFIRTRKSSQPCVLIMHTTLACSICTTALPAHKEGAPCMVCTCSKDSLSTCSNSRHKDIVGPNDTSRALFLTTPILSTIKSGQQQLAIMYRSAAVTVAHPS